MHTLTRTHTATRPHVVLHHLTSSSTLQLCYTPDKPPHVIWSGLVVKYGMLMWLYSQTSLLSMLLLFFLSLSLSRICVITKTVYFPCSITLSCMQHFLCAAQTRNCQDTLSVAYSSHDCNTSAFSPYYETRPWCPPEKHTLAWLSLSECGKIFCYRYFKWFITSSCVLFHSDPCGGGLWQLNEHLIGAATNIMYLKRIFYRNKELQVLCWQFLSGEADCSYWGSLFPVNTLSSDFICADSDIMYNM